MSCDGGLVLYFSSICRHFADKWFDGLRYYILSQFAPIHPIFINSVNTSEPRDVLYYGDPEVADISYAGIVNYYLFYFYKFNLFFFKIILVKHNPG